MHLYYSPILSASDCPLLPSMVNDLSGEELASKEVCENGLPQFNVNRDKGFYERGIMTLSKCQKFIDQLVNLAYCHSKGQGWSPSPTNVRKL